MVKDSPEERYPVGSLVLAKSGEVFEFLDGRVMLRGPDVNQLLITGYERRVRAGAFGDAMLKRTASLGEALSQDVDVEWRILGILGGEAVRSTKCFTGGGEMMKHFIMAADIRNAVG